MKRWLIIPTVLLLTPIGYFTIGALTRPRLEAIESTRHPVSTREDCIECHAPIAAEWRQSYHYRSLTGPFWARIHDKGFARIFETLRVPCKSCHAPANVLDLSPGSIPALRADAPELGVDCVSCHVSTRGITGPGRSTDAPHEVVADERFLGAGPAGVGLCEPCHEERDGSGRVVSAWRRSSFAAQEVTCVECHMPEVDAPVTADGAPRLRRSHRFPGDKDTTMLQRALHATIEVGEGERKRAVVRIVNDRVGHDLPAAGTNALIVRVEVRDDSGRVRAVEERGFGTVETVPGYLDVWPFHSVSRIPPGEHREIAIRLPSAHGTITAQFRYRDWFAITDRDVVFATLTRAF